MLRALLVFLAAAGAVSAQERERLEDAVESVSARVEPAEAKPGQTVAVKVTLKLRPNYYTQPTVQFDPRSADFVSRIRPPAAGPLVFVGDIADPPDPKTKTNSIGDLVYYTGEATWTLTAVVPPGASPGPAVLEMKKGFRPSVCSSVTEKCFAPSDLPVTAAFTVAGEAVPVEPRYAEAVTAALAARAVPKAGPKQKDAATPTVPVDVKPPVPATVAPKVLKVTPRDDYETQLRSTLEQPIPPEMANGSKGDAGFGTFLLTAALWGIITLLTPCVFPMVPITVSVFLKQSERAGTNPVMQASVYALTIVVVLGVSALTLLSAFQVLSNNPWMNLALGTLFVVFALSLFGMYDITMPQRLVNFTSAKEGGGYVGTVFMGLTFSLISFTCVAPFLGGFAALSASGNYSQVQLLAGALTFAAAFAAPFFVLALFPSLLRKMPKSGGWLNTVKVVMGFLEFAAALKFFRSAELRFVGEPTVFTYDIVLALWVASLLVMGLYLLGLFRLPHDHAVHDHVAPPRMLTGLAAIAMGVYLTPALFGSGAERNRPVGTFYAWVDAFLLPESSGETEWSGDLKGSLEAAHEKGELVFVDFTGVNCSNCRLNEKNVFPRPEVKGLMQKYRLVALYVDEVPGKLYEGTVEDDKRDDDATANRLFEKDFFLNSQLPLYAILRPLPGGKAEVLAVYAEGKINRVDLFVDFLRKPLMK